MTNEMSEDNGISATIDVRLSEIHQKLSKQQENIEIIAQKLAEINLSQTNSHNIVTKKLSKLLYFILGVTLVYYVVTIINYILIFDLRAKFVLQNIIM